MRVDLVQNGTCLLSALVWAGAEPLAGAPSDGIAKPARHAGQAGQMGRSFRGAMETRMTGERGSTLSGWTRFVPGDAGADPWLDAARLLLPFDMLAVQAASRAGERVPQARQLQTLDTSMTFFNQSAHTEWAGCRATAEAADDSIALASATMWSEADALLAVGTQQVLRRAIQMATA